jgi:hypothetical protein
MSQAIVVPDSAPEFDNREARCAPRLGNERGWRLTDICGRERYRKRPWNVGIRRLSKLDGILARRDAHQDHGCYD